MPQSCDNGNKLQVLFKVKKGTVTGEVRGTRLGWKRREVHYYRWQISTKEAGTWVRVNPNRTVDQLYLEHCVRAVRSWLKDDESSAGSE